MINHSVVDYILDFLVGSIVYLDETLDSGQGTLGTIVCKRRRKVKLIRYTRDPDMMRGADVVIYPSSFFDLDVYGTQQAYPELPLAEWRGVPLLYGSPREEWSSDGHTLIIYADIVASTYFLISRYEEMWRRNERDDRGCFPAEASLPYRAGFLQRPIVDEYGAVLRQILVDHGILDRVGAKLTPRAKGFSKVNMTYDIEHLFRYRGIRGFARAMGDGLSLATSWTYLLGRHHGDPYYESILEIIDQRSKALETNTTVKIETSLFWGVARSKCLLRKIRNRLPSRILRIILSKGDRLGISHGLLFGLDASRDTRRLPYEKDALQDKLERVTLHSRHQDLALREPEDMLDLLSIGIRHDYSMSNTDALGYRLGTCRAVRFINPNTRALTDMIMHPTLYLPAVVHQSLERNKIKQEQWERIEDVIRASARYSGELNLLWQVDKICPTLSPLNAQLHQNVLELLYRMLS